MILVMALIVYADVLIFLNTLVDYFLLLAAGKILSQRLKPIRAVLASLLGGILSLCIFLPINSVALELLYKIISAFILSAVCFKNQNFKALLKSTGVFFLISCGYGGVMFAFWQIFKPYGMVINNSVVYFNISPTVLVVCTGVGYLAFSLLWRIFGKSARLAQRCNITVFAKDNKVALRAIADTGNSLEDPFGKREVIIADKVCVEALFGTADFEYDSYLKSRYQALPCSTVSGCDLLDSFRCDRAVVECENGIFELHKPLMAISKTALKEDFNAIINPKILR